MYIGTDSDLGQNIDFENFMIDKKKYGIDVTFRELQFRKANIVYERLCSDLLNIKEIKTNELKYKKVSFDELRKIVLELFDMIFDLKYHDMVSLFNETLLNLAKIANPADAAVEYDDKNNIKGIYISDKLKSIEIPITGHEYMHALLSSYSTDLYNKIFNNYHYYELLSILIEFILSYEGDKILADDLERKDGIIRLGHQLENLNEYVSSDKLITIYGADKILKQKLEYLHHLQYGYLISEIYATRLLEIYKDDKKGLICMIISIISGEKSINDLINYYGLSLTDKTTLEAYKNKIKLFQ